MFIVIIDAHSKQTDVQIVSSTSAETTIAKLRTIFATQNSTMDLDLLAHSLKKRVHGVQWNLAYSNLSPPPLI